MQSISGPLDIIALREHLNELKAQFDQAIRKGESTTRVRQIYLLIKELENELEVPDNYLRGKEN